jgi:hypothetical protein
MCCFAVRFRTLGVSLQFLGLSGTIAARTVAGSPQRRRAATLLQTTVTQIRLPLHDIFDGFVSEGLQHLANIEKSGAQHRTCMFGICVAQV